MCNNVDNSLISDNMFQYTFQAISIFIVHVCLFDIEIHTFNTEFRISPLSLSCLMIWLSN